MKYTLLDDIGKHFLNRAIELVKAGHKFVFVLDNIEWEVKHMISERTIRTRVCMQ